MLHDWYHQLLRVSKDAIGKRATNVLATMVTLARKFSRQLLHWLSR